MDRLSDAGSIPASSTRKKLGKLLINSGFPGFLSLDESCVYKKWDEWCIIVACPDVRKGRRQRDGK